MSAFCYVQIFIHILCDNIIEEVRICGMSGKFLTSFTKTITEKR